METAEEARRQIFRRYEQDPTGWHVFSGKDQRGYHETTVLHHQDIWFLKEEFINPYEPVGFAVKERLETKPGGVPPVSFGFRPLQRDLLLQGPDKFDERLFTQMLDAALIQQPVPLSQLNSPVALQGPFLGYRGPGPLTPYRRNEVDDELGAELDPLIARKYGHLKRMYG